MCIMGLMQQSLLRVALITMSGPCEFQEQSMVISIALVVSVSWMMAPNMMILGASIHL